jgi:predicted SprT family Zn-dependent metalloprotease
MTMGSEQSNRYRKVNRLSTDLISDALNERAGGWIRQWRVPTLLHQICLRRNNSLRTTIARWRESEKCLELGPRFFRMRRRQDEIICHELAHAAALQIYGEGVLPHGAEWRALIAAAGYLPSATFTPAKSSSQVSRRMGGTWYEHRCPVCHAVRFAKKRMPRWRCPECTEHGLPGLLEIDKSEERR